MKESKNLNPLTLDHLKSIYEVLRQHEREHGDEPLPSFDRASKEKLQSAIQTVEAEYFGESNYTTLIEKAVAYLYFLNKSHALPNGNKRFSIACFKIYVYLNQSQLRAPHEFLQEVAILIAQSDPEDKDALLRDLTKFMKNNSLIIQN